MQLLVKQEKTKKERIKSLFLVVISLAVGFLNGFFGGGGGMLAVPALHYVEGLPEKESHATAIGIILPLSILSGAVYLIKGAFPVFDGLMAGTGVLAGGILGALLLKKLSNKVISSIFYLVMIGAGIKMLF